MVRRIGPKVRVLRVRRGWRQADLAAGARVSRGLVSAIERDLLDAVTLGSLTRVIEALDARLLLEVQWRGADLDRLLDARHASLVDWLASVLRRLGWDVRPEVSFNRYGDRGCYDLIAFHPTQRMCLVVEVKTVIGDIQDLLGRLDVKLRVARQTALAQGWRPAAIIPLLVIASDSTNRRHVRNHPALFERFVLRGRDVTQWLRQPREVLPGLLFFKTVPNASGGSLTSVRRVRKRVMQVTPAGGAESPASAGVAQARAASGPERQHQRN
ncbi:MAG TPA: helix-turn-helix domain-containing protein [Candidatus Limnocylindria bacterium]